MAVISVEEMTEASGGWDKLWRRTYARKYRVECDSVNDDEFTIRSALSGGKPWLPRIGSPMQNGLGVVRDAGAFLEDVQYARKSRTPEGCEWELTLKYGPYDASVFGQNPVQWPLRFSFGMQKYERAVDTAYDGSGNPTVAIVNSAYCRFADPVTIDDSRTILTVKRNEPCHGKGAFDLTLAESYRDKVNDATWNGFAAKVVKCTSITTGDQEYDSNSQAYFFPVTYIFELNRDTWAKTILDQGYQALDSGSPPKPTPITNDGKEVKEPVLLDGSGGELATTGSPVFLTFDVYPAVDFSVFNIKLAAGIGMS